MTLVIHQESGNQPLETREQVGYVVMNRMANNDFPDTCHEVVLQKGQFSWVASHHVRGQSGLRKRYDYWNNQKNPLIRKQFAISKLAAKRVVTRVAKKKIGKATHFVTSGFKNTWTKHFKRQKIHGIDFLHKR